MGSLIKKSRTLDLDPDWQPLAEMARRYHVSLAHVRRLALLHKVDWMRGTERVGDHSPVFVSCRSMERWAKSRVGLIKRLYDVDPSCC